jgi:hypothetical protein
VQLRRTSLSPCSTKAGTVRGTTRSRTCFVVCKCCAAGGSAAFRAHLACSLLAPNRAGLSSALEAFTAVAVRSSGTSAGSGFDSMRRGRTLVAAGRGSM